MGIITKRIIIETVEILVDTLGPATKVLTAASPSGTNHHPGVTTKDQILGAFAAIVLLLALKPNAVATQLITNGDFEIGTLAHWTTFDQVGGSGSFFNDGLGGVTPLSDHLTAGPAGGSFYAVSDQGGPGAHALFQAFVVSAGSTVHLSFDMFVNDWSGSGPIVNPAGLDYTADPNQYARVDILKNGANPLSTAPGDVVGNFYLSVDPGFAPHSYTAYSFDITSLVGGGGTFVLRFAEVDNQFFLNQGVDNVSITQTSGVPEGGNTIMLVTFALTALAGMRRTVFRERLTFSHKRSA
jgi:hypothetical protein